MLNVWAMMNTFEAVFDMVKNMHQDSQNGLKKNFFTYTLFLLFEPYREKTGLLHMRKKDADQLRGNREADQRLCFRYIDSTIPILCKYEISSF